MAAHGTFHAEEFRTFPKGVRPGWHVQRPSHRVRERFRITHGHELAPSSTLQNLLRSEWAIGADYRTTACHCLDQDGRKAFMSGRQYEQRSSREERVWILDKP